jgi:hypothetical protein
VLYLNNKNQNTHIENSIFASNYAERVKTNDLYVKVAKNILIIISRLKGTAGAVYLFSENTLLSIVSANFEKNMANVVNHSYFYLF